MPNFSSDSLGHEVERTKKPPKGILKNSNPNATYRKHSSLNKRIEDLIEYERPLSSPPSRSSNWREEDDYGDDFAHHEESCSGTSSTLSTPSSPSSTVVAESSPRHHRRSDKHRHGHHHSHKSKHRSSRSSKNSDPSDGSVDVESRRSSSSSSSRHHRHHHKSSRNRDSENDDRAEGNSGGYDDGGESIERSKRSSRHHRHQHKSSRNAATEDDEIMQEMNTNRNDDSCIYDLPKMPPVPVHVPPPKSYVTEEKLEDLYNKVTKGHRTTSKSLQASLSDDDDSNEVRHEIPVETGLYENIGFEKNNIVDSKNSNQEERDETFEMNEEDEYPTEGNLAKNLELLYDVPRSNRRVTTTNQIASEAIYVNDDFMSSNDNTYDRPRSADLPETHIAEIYNAPGTRDSLSTIEEEHQEYDIPKANMISQAFQSERGHQTYGDEENIYVNTLTNSKINKHDNQLHLPQEDTMKSSDFSSHGGDDRSSGYRSSSSPSIQSTEEFYVNESAIGSMDDISSPEAHQITHTQIEIQGTGSLNRKNEREQLDNRKKNSSPSENYRKTTPKIKESSSTEALLKKNDAESNKTNGIRNKVTSNGTEIPETNILKKQRDLLRREEMDFQYWHEDGKSETSPEICQPKIEEVKKSAPKKETEKPRSKATPSIQPPRSFYVEHVSNKIVEVEEGSTKGLLKKFESKTKAPQPPSTPKSTTEPVRIQKDRSLDIYNETVRQRASRQNGGVDLFKTKEIFAKDPVVEVSDSGPKKLSPVREKNVPNGKAMENPKPTSSEVTPKTQTIKKRKAPQPQHRVNIGISDINDDELPSVRQLRDKFEVDTKFASDTKLNVVESSASNKKREAINKLALRKGFNVMSSLTRRGASALSISMHNLSTDHDNRQEQNNSKNIKKRPSIINSEDVEHHQPQPQQYKQPDFDHLTEYDIPEKTIALVQNPDEDEDGKVENSSANSRWNPSDLVSKMYKLQAIAGNQENDQNDDANLEGFLERLPPGKKKSTIWNSWKRQYFVAKNGLLLIFPDQTRQVLMDRIELFGGRVDFMESTMLGIQDRRGHYVVIKCGDENTAKDWQRVILKHIHRDFDRTFAVPISIPKSPNLFSKVLVVDFGGASVRAGIAAATGPTLPHLFFPTVMAVGKSSDDEKYFGFDAFAPEIRSSCTLSQPLAPSGKIDKMSVDVVALQGIFEKIFKDLDIEPSSYEIQLSAPRPFGEQTKRKICNMLFHEFHVQSVNMAHQTVFALYSYNAKSGVIVDLGERMDIVPVVDGYKVSSGVSNLSVGGMEIRHKLQHYLQGRNYTLGSFVDEYLLRYIIESSLFMSRHFDKELDRYRRNPDKINLTVNVDPGTNVNLGSERFETCEGLFKPELWGLDQAGIHVLVHKAIRECGVDVRKEMTQNIFLAGGLTLIPGFKERLEVEVEKLTPAKPRVHASPYRYHAAYIGACLHATSEEYKSVRITQNDWLNRGDKIEKLWNM